MTAIVSTLKRNPWIAPVVVFVALILIGIAVS